jgi:hypothetical protein
VVSQALKRTLHVDLAAPLHVERDAVALALLEPQRDVVGDLVEAAEVGVAEERDQLRPSLRSGWAGFLPPSPNRPQASAEWMPVTLVAPLLSAMPGLTGRTSDFAAAVRQQADEREFDDAVVLDVEAGGLEVEEDDGALELEEHGGGSGRRAS